MTTEPQPSADLETSPPSPPSRPRNKQPGILDRIAACESREAASLLWFEFLDSVNCVSQKTINRAQRLLATLDFPLP